jgi:hypothetical protein
MAVGMAGLGYAAQRVIVATAAKAAHEVLLEKTSITRAALEEGEGLEECTPKDGPHKAKEDDTFQRNMSAETVDSQIAMVKEIEARALSCALNFFQKGTVLWP